MSHNGSHRSAEIEREVAAQRSRIESTIGEIKERLTPGQLVDEVLSYTKNGGADVAASLGRQISANPMPAALLGVSLAWLMMGPRQPQHVGNGFDGRAHGSAEPIYGTISGNGLKRVSHARDDAGEWYSDFTDDSGRTFRARSNEIGHRAGHFMDEAGRSYTGFIDGAGRRVSQFQDEAGNMLEEAAGWANHTWQDVSEAAGGLADSAMRAGSDMQANAARMTRDTMRMLEDQPLIMGALAFAAGAAIGATLPATRQEDEILGEAADEVKMQAGEVASELYEEGRERAAEVYEEAADQAGEIYGDAKRRLADTTEGGLPDTRH